MIGNASGVATVLVAGHLCLDVTPALPGEPSLRPGDLWTTGPLTLSPGGCVANTGAALLDLGVDVAVCADVGEDVGADTLTSLVRDLGFDVEGLRRTGGRTSYSIVLQPPGADRTFWHHVGANESFDGSAVAFAGEKLLHVGYPTLLPALVKDDGRPLVELLTAAHRAGLVTSIDLAVVSEPTTGSHAFWRRVLAAALPEVDVITPSFDDLATGLGVLEIGTATPESLLAAAAELVQTGAAIALVSGGAAGFGLATAGPARFAGAGPMVAELETSWHDVRMTAPAVRLAESATTNGAGDAATAGFLHGLIEGFSPAAAMEAAAAAAAARISGWKIGSRPMATSDGGAR
ncbi:sugar/nucleoside kinase (ribokinase family) [Nakamurella sp. UYEF19]|uniref:carbohydrate kinase family protein n=1 Tax=Nakamurella sp. UYEF19 TaxID=1756392 RepID=UPI003391856A